MRQSSPRLCQKALADLVRFGKLQRFGNEYAATQLHLPELAHESKVIEALISGGLAVGSPDQTLAPTAKGREEHAAIEAERLGKVPA